MVELSINLSFLTSIFTKYFFAGPRLFATIGRIWQKIWRKFKKIPDAFNCKLLRHKKSIEMVLTNMLNIKIMLKQYFSNYLALEIPLKDSYCFSWTIALRELLQATKLVIFRNTSVLYIFLSLPCKASRASIWFFSHFLFVWKFWSLS